VLNYTTNNFKSQENFSKNNISFEHLVFTLFYSHFLLFSLLDIAFFEILFSGIILFKSVYYSCLLVFSKVRIILNFDL